MRKSTGRRAKAKRSANPEKARKNEIVRFRVTAEQKHAFGDAAAREGLEVSAWLRQLALKASGQLPESR